MSSAIYAFLEIYVAVKLIKFIYITNIITEKFL
jgi:hypothetical protein